MASLCKFPVRLSMTDTIRSGPVVVVLSFFLAGGLAVSESSRGDEKPAKSNSKGSAISKPASDLAYAPADEGDVEVDEDLSDLVVPARFLDKPKAADRLKYSQELRGLLVEGFKEKGVGLEAARKHLDSAHRLVVDDPRASYAYALVLLAQKKGVLALEQFRSAARLKKVPFLPALQGIAWMSLSRGEHAQALTALVDLARRLEESQETWPTVQDKERSAEWLGRMIGFLVGPGKTAAQAAPIDKLAADVARLLTAERKQACERGLKAAAARYQELQAYAARPADEVLAEARQKSEEIFAAAATAESEARQIEDEIKELKKPYDKQLADLSREIRSNGTIVKSTAPKVPEARAEVEELSAPKKHPQMKSQGIRRPAKVVAREENAGEKKIRESQLAAAEKNLDQLTSSLEAARKRVVEARKERDEAQVEFRKATAGKRQALHAAQHKAAELSARAREAEHGTLTPEKLKARVTALEAYVPLYPELEKDRLLATVTSAP